MPTPHGDTFDPQTPPPELPSRGSFASCPPEEEREPHAPREPRDDTASTDALLDEDEHVIRQFTTPEPDAQEGASRGLGVDGAKAEHVEDAGVITVGDALPSPASSPREMGSDSDVKIGQPLEVAGSSAKAWRKDQEDEATPLYLYYPPLTQHRVCATLVVTDLT